MKNKMPPFVFGGVYFLFMGPFIHSVALSWARFGTSTHINWPVYHSLMGLFFIIFGGACIALLQKPLGRHSQTEWLQFLTFFAGLQNLMSYLLGPMKIEYVLLLLSGLISWLFIVVLKPKSSPHDGWISMGIFCGAYLCSGLIYLL